MPWKAERQEDGRYAIIRSDTGAVVGHSDTRTKALASIRARYANSSDTAKTGSKALRRIR